MLLSRPPGQRSSRVTRAVASHTSSCPLSAEDGPCVAVPGLPSRSPDHRLLSYFPSGALVRNAPVNILTQVFTDKHLGGELLSHEIELYPVTLLRFSMYTIILPTATKFRLPSFQFSFSIFFIFYLNLQGPSVQFFIRNRMSEYPRFIPGLFPIFL